MSVGVDGHARLARDILQQHLVGWAERLTVTARTQDELADGLVLGEQWQPHQLLDGRAHGRGRRLALSTRQDQGDVREIQCIGNRLNDRGQHGSRC